jgi:phage terminase large subunit GpA-like protein
MNDDHFAVALSDICSAHEAYRPPRRVSVSEGAAANLWIKQPGGYVGPWSADETPYMVEPMDMLASRRHETVASSGRRGQARRWGCSTVGCARRDQRPRRHAAGPDDAGQGARVLERTRIDRALRNSPNACGDEVRSAQDDNTHDKSFKHGMWLRIAWPTVPNLSSSDYRYVALTDYDRMPDDVGGEGSPFTLGLKRTTTFLSRGMCMVESSPGRDLTDPNWRPAAPRGTANGGILASTTARIAALVLALPRLPRLVRSVARPRPLRAAERRGRSSRWCARPTSTTSPSSTRASCARTAAPSSRRSTSTR